MVPGTVGELHIRWYPETTTLRVSENPDQFDPALESTARSVDVWRWVEFNGRSLPLVNTHGHSAKDILNALKLIVLEQARKERAKESK